MESQAFQPQHQALRVVLEFQQGNFRILERQLINKRVQPSDPIYDQKKDGLRSGTWIELRDGEGKTLYRQILHNPFGHSAEVHSSDSPDRIHRLTNPNPQGVINLLVPDLPNAQTLVLMSSPVEGEKAFQAAQEIIQFDVKAIKAGKL